MVWHDGSGPDFGPFVFGFFPEDEGDEEVQPGRGCVLSEGVDGVGAGGLSGVTFAGGMALARVLLGRRRAVPVARREDEVSL